MDELRNLRQEFRKFGWYRKATGRILFELLIHVAIALTGIAIVASSQHIALQTVGMLLTVLGSIGIGTNSHTSSHNATSDVVWVNHLLTYFGYTCCLGLSASFWRDKHVLKHHIGPNVIGVDEDVAPMPWFALTDRDIERCGIGRRRYYRLQIVVLPLGIILNGLKFQLKGWVFLLRELAKPSRQLKHWLDVGALVTHLVLCFGLVGLFYPPSNVVMFYLIWLALMGPALFLVLAPAHFPAEAACLDKSLMAESFVLRQTVATVNFRTGSFGHFLCSGSEYQIEHHLFPNVSHVYYPAMSRHVQDFCRQRGYPYRSLRWGEAIWKSFTVFRFPKTVQSLMPSRPPILPEAPPTSSAMDLEELVAFPTSVRE